MFQNNLAAAMLVYRANPMGFELISLASCERAKHCWMLEVTSVCTRCCVLLGFVEQSLKAVKLLSKQLLTFLFFRDRRSVARNNFGSFAQLFQHCWRRLRTLHMVSKVLCVVSLPPCTASPNIVGTCCFRLHHTANTDATNPNIVSCVF